MAGGTSIYGLSSGTSGFGYGVVGEVDSDNNMAYGVYGYARGSGSGVGGYANSATGYAVVGQNRIHLTYMSGLNLRSYCRLSLWGSMRGQERAAYSAVMTLFPLSAETLRHRQEG
jgi:hypothetical protein